MPVYPAVEVFDRRNLGLPVEEARAALQMASQAGW